MSMTKQHFEAIAEALSCMDGVETDGIEDTYEGGRLAAINAVASALRQFNRRFDRKLFRQACE
jgi:hypothetical protein|tara:strand:- start:47 stop:235 length:189 start_codon:yes stop_codon:yes gene_type:complete